MTWVLTVWVLAALPASSEEELIDLTLLLWWKIACDLNGEKIQEGIQTFLCVFSTDSREACATSNPADYPELMLKWK